MIVRREAACLVATKDVIEKNGFKITEARRLKIPIVGVLEIDQLLSNPTKFELSASVISASVPNASGSLRSSAGPTPEPLWSPEPLPVDLNELVPHFPLRYSSNSIPRPEPVQIPIPLPVATPLPETTNQTSEDDFWSFGTPTPTLAAAPTAPVAVPLWRPPSPEVPLDLNSLVPQFEVPKMPTTNWKTRSVFNMTKAGVNSSDLALIDVKNRVLALLSVENSSLVVIDPDDYNEGDEQLPHRRYRFVDPAVTYVEVVKTPHRDPPRKSPSKPPSLTPEQILKTPSPAFRSMKRRLPMAEASHFARNHHIDISEHNLDDADDW